MKHLRRSKSLLVSFLFTLLVAIVLASTANVATAQEGFDMNYEASEQNAVLATASQARGLEALKQVLDSTSRETNSPAIREVLVQAPTEVPNVEGLDYLNELPGIVATSLFYQIVEPSEPGDEALETFGRNGQRARLPEGGILHLRVNSNRTPTSATIAVSGARIPGYERVSQMRFILAE